MISSTVVEAVWEGTLSCKRQTFFWTSQGHNFFSFSLSFFQNYFWIVSHSSTFWHETSQHYSMWIPKSNQHSLASRWRQLKLFRRWGTTRFSDLDLSLTPAPPKLWTPAIKGWTGYAGFRRNFSAIFEKSGNVLHHLKAGIFLQISVPPA